MTITKRTIEDKFEIVTEYKHIQVRTVTIIEEDGVELSRSITDRQVWRPDMDLSNASDDVKAIGNALWTDELKQKWEDFKTARLSAQ